MQNKGPAVLRGGSMSYSATLMAVLLLNMLVTVFVNFNFF